MPESLSERRMAENEVVFRKYNESVKEGFDELEAIAKEDGQEVFVDYSDTPIHFYCECSDENCRLRIQLPPSLFAQLHEKRDQFILIPGHEVDSIEDIIERYDNFCVVRKFYVPPEEIETLNKTPVDNT